MADVYSSNHVLSTHPVSIGGVVLCFSVLCRFQEVILWAVLDHPQHHREGLSVSLRRALLGSVTPDNHLPACTLMTLNNPYVPECSRALNCPNSTSIPTHQALLCVCRLRQPPSAKRCRSVVMCALYALCEYLCEEIGSAEGCVSYTRCASICVRT